MQKDEELVKLATDGENVDREGGIRQTKGEADDIQCSGKVGGGFYGKVTTGHEEDAQGSYERGLREENDWMWGHLENGCIELHSCMFYLVHSTV